MMKIAISIFIVSFLLLRPYALQYNGMWYSGDDQDYFAHASSIVFGQYPSYQKEHLTINKEYPQSSIGCGLIIAPFVWIFSFLDRWLGLSIVDQRTGENIPGSWSQFGFVFGSYLYFVLAVFMLYRGLRYHFQERYAFLSVILTVLCQGLPLFALRRPIFSHSAEFFIQSVFVFLLLKNCVAGKKFPSRLRDYCALGCLSALILLTRYNDIGFALVWPLIFIWNSNHWSAKQWGKLFLSFLVFAGMILVFKVWPETYNQQHPYQWTGAYLHTHLTWGDFYHRIVHIFGGLDWGLVYTAPYILLGFIALLLFKHRCRKFLLCLMGALLINFYIIIIWGSQGGWYGYRYFIPSAIPLFVMPVAMFIESMEKKFNRKLTLLWVIIAIPPALSMIFFEGNSTTLTLHVIPQSFGRVDWSNDTYQSAVWQTMTNIHLIWQPLLKGGMYYLVYLLHVLGFSFGKDDLGVLVRYPIFEWKILIRTLMIYVTPFIVWFFIRKTDLKH